jgi:hypothetical protein
MTTAQIVLIIAGFVFSGGLLGYIKYASDKKKAKSDAPLENEKKRIDIAKEEAEIERIKIDNASANLAINKDLADSIGTMWGRLSKLQNTLEKAEKINEDQSRVIQEQLEYLGELRKSLESCMNYFDVHNIDKQDVLDNY